MYVKTVDANVKGDIHVELGPRTLLLGRSASGKTAILNAIELALTGRASDVAGKADVARPSDLCGLAPNGALRAQVVCDNGAVYRYELEPGRKPVHMTPPDGPNAQLPLRVFREESTSADKLRRFILQVCGPRFTEEDLLTRLDPAVHDAFRAVADPELLASDPVAALVAARDASNRDRLDTQAALRTCRDLLDRTPEAMEGPPTDDELVQAEEAYQAARVEAYRDHLRRQARAALQAKRAAERRVAALQTRLDDGHVTPAADIERKAELVAAATALVRAHRDRNATRCVCCGQGAVDWTAREALLGSAAEQLRDVLHAVEQRRQLAEKLRAAQADVLAAQRALDDLRARAQEPPPMTYYSAECEQARDRLEALRTRRAQWNQVREAREQIADLEERVHGAKRLVKACDEAIARVFSHAVKDFCASVQMYLPETDTFAVDAETGRFGLQRNGMLHWALSGAEWARVTAAIAAVVSAHTDGLSVVIPEERAYDRETLSIVMRALSGAPCQVILTSTVKPKGRAPAGWTVVEVDG